MVLRSMSCLLVLLLTGVGCAGSDHVEPLGHGCMYRNEGSTLKDVLCDGGEIPATVTALAYDDDFVIARQTPGFQDILYSQRYVYDEPNGEYYWIIDHRAATIDGPLSAPEYAEARAQLGIPDDLTLD